MAFSTWLVLGSLAILLHATVCAVQRARPQPGQTHTSHLTHTSARRKANSDLHHHSLLALADREYLKAVQQPFIYSPFMVRRMHCHLAALSSLTFFWFFSFRDFADLDAVYSCGAHGHMGSDSMAGLIHADPDDGSLGQTVRCLDFEKRLAACTHPESSPVVAHSHSVATHRLAQDHRQPRTWAGLLAV